MRRLSSWLIVGAMLVPLAAVAETAYVTDHVTVGLRADVTPDAAVVKTVSTGAALEVLEHNGSFAKVRDSEGAEGWIEAASLSPQPPAAQQLKTLRAELDRTRAQLVNAQTQLDKNRSVPAPDIGKLQAELAATRTQLIETQAELKKKEQEMVTAAAKPPVETPTPLVPGTEPQTGFSVLWLAIAFAMLVLGFMGGIVWVRESIRRRMGGLYLRI